MNAIQLLVTSRVGEGIVFAAVIGFTVLSLESLRIRFERSPSTPRMVVAFLAFCFGAMAIGGAVAWAIVGKPGFLSLGLFLTGTAGCGILFDLVRNGPREAEQRRIEALDI